MTRPARRAIRPTPRNKRQWEQDHERAEARDAGDRRLARRREYAHARLGAHQLCIFEQFCDPGHGAPMHIHAVEEVLEVMEGTAEIFLGAESCVVEPDQSVVIPAGARHGFKNIGTGILKVRATMAASIFEASYDGRSELSRRYSPT
jgi:mannose-6-phosphate isomerase-like protein (cupin superfamily)